MSDENKTSLWLQLAVAGVVIALAIKFIDPFHPVEKDPEPVNWSIGYSGRVDTGVLSGNEFVFTVWHHYPGILHSGELRVMMYGEHVNDGRDKIGVFSFESWAPNKDNAQTFKVKLAAYTTPVTIAVRIHAKECDSTTTYRWTGTTWDK